MTATMLTASTVVTLNNDRSLDSAATKCLGPVQPEIGAYRNDEPFAAVDPRDSRHVIAAWQTRGSKGSVVQWSASTNGGRSWTQPQSVAINACAGGPLADAVRAGDPWAAFAPDGRAYISAVAWTPNPSGKVDSVSSLIVASSIDGGVTWPRPVIAALAPSPTTGFDNLAITADPLQPGTVYAVSTQDEFPDSTHYYGRVAFTRSLDAGRTWSPVKAISPAVDRQRASAPQIVADPKSGTLYAVYSSRRRGSMSVRVMTSSDRGESWSDEAVAATYIAAPEVNDPATGKPFVLADDIVRAIVAPSDHRIFVAYSDAWRAPGKRRDVSVVWSTDGKSWSKPLAVSDSASGTAWLPAIVLTSTGDPVVTHFSADFTPQSKKIARIRVMIARLHRTSEGFELSSRSTIDEAGIIWPGDYQALVSSENRFVAVYGREGRIVSNRR